MDVKRATTAAAVSAAMALASPSPARAQEAVTCLPDQAVAVLDQYCDALITPGGSSQAIGSKGGGKSLSEVLPAADVRRVRGAGRAGKALLALTVASTVSLREGAPAAPRVRRQRAAARRAVAPERLKPPATDVASITSGVVAVSGDVLGGTFRWGLVICTLGLSGMAWLRFRTRLKL